MIELSYYISLSCTPNRPLKDKKKGLNLIYTIIYNTLFDVIIELGFVKNDHSFIHACSLQQYMNVLFDLIWVNELGIMMIQSGQIKHGNGARRGRVSPSLSPSLNSIYCCYQYPYFIIKKEKEKKKTQIHTQTQSK